MTVVSATTQPTKTATKNKATKEKDPKEKRESPTANPYSYEPPQKSFHTPLFHVNQQKHTNVEHYSPQHKVAPLEYLPKHEAPQQQQQYHYEQVHQQQQQFHPTSFNPPPMAPVEHLFNEVPVKEIEDFSFNYPHFESFSNMPSSFYSNDFEKIIAVPVNSYSSIKAPYSYPAPAASYNYPQHSYPMNNYAPSIPAHYTASFTQSPGALFIPQSVSIPHKHAGGKTPDYSHGSKGLSHFSTVSSLAPISSSYKNQHSHDVPSYAFSQTERPFKPSAFLGASVISHEHSNEHFVPSKTYLPSKEYHHQPQQHIAQQYAAQAVPVEYQIQYVQVPAGKSYLPSSNNYLPVSKPVVEHQPPKSSYLPASVAIPSKPYLPPQQPAPVKIEHPKNSYLPPQNTYLPPNNPYAGAASPQQSHYHYQPQSHEVYADSSAEYRQPMISGHK